MVKDITLRFRITSSFKNNTKNSQLHVADLQICRTKKGVQSRKYNYNNVYRLTLSLLNFKKALTYLSILAALFII